MHARTHAQVLKRTYAHVRKSIFSKNGIGTLRRFIEFVPAFGEGSVHRPVRGCKTLAGSKPYRQFIDVGSDDGTEIEIRLRSCHECPGCISLSDFKSCKNMEKLGMIAFGTPWGTLQASLNPRFEKHESKGGEGAARASNYKGKFQVL